MEASNILPAIDEAAGSIRLPHDMKEFAEHVVDNFLKKKISSKVAAKRIAALYGDETLVTEIHPVFVAYESGIPLSQAKSVPEPQISKSGVWTMHEDNLLVEAVRRFGTSDWARVAEEVGNGRNKRQCAQRWERSLNPTISRETWTEKEIKLLVEGVKRYGMKSWVKVAKHVGTRSDVQCRYKYKSTLADDIPKRKLKFTNSIPKSKKPKEPETIDNSLGKETKENEFSFLDKLGIAEDFLTSISF